MDAISILVGGAVGFLVSVGKDWLLENKNQKEKDKQFKKEKIEEIFSLLDQVNKNAMNPIQLYDPNVNSLPRC